MGDDARLVCLQILLELLIKVFVQNSKAIGRESSFSEAVLSRPRTVQCYDNCFVLVASVDEPRRDDHQDSQAVSTPRTEVATESETHAEDARVEEAEAQPVCDSARSACARAIDEFVALLVKNV